jgi:Polyketide cyclase / dehydrase and lipid transport
MTHGRDIGLSVLDASPKRPQPKSRAAGWFWHLGWLFPRNAATDTVSTSVHFRATPESVWQRVLMYEEVPALPPFLLRLLLPSPVRAQGEKTRVGSAVQCTYDGGHLVKRITFVEPHRLLEFEVVEQRLGIEACVTTLSGSYRILSRGVDSEIILTTNYLGHLRPRRCWRPLERLLSHQLHGHILDGIRASLLRSDSTARSTTAEASIPKSSPGREPACTTSQLSSRR